MIFNFLKNPEIYKFAIIGSINGIFLLFLSWVFTSYLGIFYVASAFISYEICIITSFFMNDRWTFRTFLKTNKIHIRLIKYNIFYLIGMIMNGLILILFTDFIGFHYLISQAMTLLIVFSFNYITSKKISFKN